ncbi:hypothetical protein GmHk_09G024680 [Glycine max]|nr:hypothetical protein GmHk_09G024680 [Glycine max]
MHILIQPSHSNLFYLIVSTSLFSPLIPFSLTFSSLHLYLPLTTSSSLLDWESALFLFFGFFSPLFSLFTQIKGKQRWQGMIRKTISLPRMPRLGIMQVSTARCWSESTIYNSCGDIATKTTGRVDLISGTRICSVNFTITKLMMFLI